MPANHGLTIIDDARADGLPLPKTLAALQAAVTELRTLAQPQPDPVLDLGNDVKQYARRLAEWCRTCTDTKAVRAAAAEMVTEREAQVAGAVLDVANAEWPKELDDRFEAALDAFVSANEGAPAEAPGLRDAEAARAAWLAVEEAGWALDRIVTWRANLGRMRGEERCVPGNLWLSVGLPPFGNDPPVHGSQSHQRLAAQLREWLELSTSQDGVARWRWRIATGWPLRLAPRNGVVQTENALTRWYYDGASGVDPSTFTELGAGRGQPSVRV